MPEVKSPAPAPEPSRAAAAPADARPPANEGLQDEGPQDEGPQDEGPQDESANRAPAVFGIHPLKWVFALEYVMQGLANPFQGITYQPFFRHFKVDYGLSEAATQTLFAKSYLAWSFKPVLGFLIDAYGRTRTLLCVLLATATLGFLVTNWVDVSANAFFAFMFALSIVLAATDVSVDRATVIAGDAEARETGRSKATTVGLNQAICWTAIYGTSIVAAVIGGYVAEHVPFGWLMAALSLVPFSVLLMAWRLPRERALPIPLSRSIGEFWRGLNSGPILAVMLFFFVFHFQPMMGPLWTNYLIERLHFTQTQVGISDGATNVGYLAGVLLFAWQGVKLQERLGLRKLFRIYIVASTLLGLGQYLLVDPWFSAIARAMAVILPFSEDTVRLVYLSAYNSLLYLGHSLIRMSAFSLVGVVVPVRAAGSLFAGFMSIANLAYAFALASGAWLYDHGLELSSLRAVQVGLFGIPAEAGQSMSVQMLILFNAAAFLLSFLCVRGLPDRRQTQSTRIEDPPGPERWLPLGPGVLRGVNLGALALGLACLYLTGRVWELDWISAALSSFFGVTMLRKALLDSLLERRLAPRPS